MKKTALIAAAAALATISTGASAAFVSNINSLKGDFLVEGFADGTPVPTRSSSQACWAAAT